MLECVRLSPQTQESLFLDDVKDAAKSLSETGDLDEDGSLYFVSRIHYTKTEVVDGVIDPDDIEKTKCHEDLKRFVSSANGGNIIGFVPIQFELQDSSNLFRHELNMLAYRKARSITRSDMTHMVYVR
tara:strand:- start:22 stop:405 length:384 start_codon:yes stop_codon:yes gene_type:complete